MAFGDIGGPVTELVITCRTKSNGTVAIKRGDALTLTGNYTVEHAAAAGDTIIGQAMADCDRNAAAIPVRLRGICEFAHTGNAPAIGTGIVASATAGSVCVPASGTGRGIVLKTDTDNSTVHVLI